MSENLHDIDKLFRDSIEGQEEMPSGKVWDAIDNNLDKSNVIQIKRKYNNLKRLAIALLLLLLGTIIYEIQSKKSDGERVAVDIMDNGTYRKVGATNKNDSGEKNTPNATEGKQNSTSETATGTNGTASDNTEMKNAGKDLQNDSLNNLVEKDEQKLKQKTAIGTEQKSKNKFNIKNPKAEGGDEMVNENAPSLQVTKSPIKKSSVHKTKIAIKNPAAQEDEIADENDIVSHTNNKTKVAAGANELRALQHDKAEKITGDLKKNDLVKIETRRIAPDATIASAKNKSLKNPKPFHINIMPFYSPQFSFNRLEDDHHDPGPQPRNGREEIKNDEQHETTSSFGILVQVPAGKKWSLQSGITYLNKKISIEPKKIFAKLDNDGKIKYRFDCSSGYTYINPKTGTSPAVGDSVSAAASTNTLQYVGIPLAVNYTLSFGKFSIMPTAGTTINFLTKQQIETELIQGSTKEKQTISTIQGLKKTYFNAFAALALEYNLSKRIALNLTPTGSFALTSINKDAAVKSYPNSFGIITGIKIKF
ncbi:hypothetical protein [Ferruginibacter sp. SUN106]|uniref:hypothetical protein n=1 Tax=Ferruginibacter sp. SUN106 TaxID=2978348 RepID=UPI003D36E364